MKLKLLQKLFFISSISLFLGFQIQGQTMNEAIDAYNTGIGLIDDDIKAAIENLEKSREIASQLGEEGEELKEQAEIQIPGLYYDMAMDSYRERNINQAVEDFEKTIEVSEELNDPSTKQRAENVLHQLYAIQANAAFRENNNDQALSLFQKALEINPQHARSHLGKGLVYRRLEDSGNFKESMDMAIQAGLTASEENIVETAESTARDFFLVRAVRAKNEENYSQAIDFLSTSLSYDETFPETHFVLASVYNEQSNYEDAVNSARRAIDLLNGSPEETAKMYFQLGEAYAGLGNTSEACAAFKEAAYGSYEESANYQIEHVLNCN